MKKKSLIIISAICGAMAAEASFDISLKGSYDFQAGYRKQPSEYLLSDNYSASIFHNQKKYAFNSYAKTGLLLEQKEQNLKYGSNIMLSANTASNNKLDGDFSRTYIYAENGLGQLKLGADYAASVLMSYGAHNVASAAGGASNGDWSNYIYDPAFANHTEASYGYFKQWVNLLYNLRQDSEPPYNITYVTPKILDFQFGITYIPDGGNVAASSITTQAPLRYLKNIWSLAATYNQKYNKLDYGISLTYDRGSNGSKNIANDKVDSLQNFQLGTKLAYEKFGFAASYSQNSRHFGQPLTQALGLIDSDIHKNKIYSLGMSYTHNKFSSSLTYANKKTHVGNSDASLSYNDLLDIKAISLGADYLLFSGMKTYAEITRYIIKNSVIENNVIDNGSFSRNKGYALLAGFKVQF